MKLIIRQLGIQPYEDVWHQMQSFTDHRDENTDDEIWLVQHPAVFTQGSAGKPEHLLNPTNIPVVQSDRGGQITYHGEGQQIMYVLIDIKRLKSQGREVSVRDLVTALEQTVVRTLADYGIESYPKADAPGVYVNERKICSLGLRIRKGCSFHGLALNINMDLTPFRNINPCGYAGLEMCQLSELINQNDLDCSDISPKLVEHFSAILDYNDKQFINN
ncbi:MULTISPECIES: lipoyl(octanoyl) transferase LipB [unclassified Mannheimia]|uniref:lipoyl(octanoyl) transferase LipB n=1 Tax=unclassified Mannheimia TaxID=2645054 RepID=UPI00359D04AF